MCRRLVPLGELKPMSSADQVEAKREIGGSQEVPEPNGWLQRGEMVLTIGAFLIVAVAFVISRLFGS